MPRRVPLSVTARRVLVALADAPGPLRAPELVELLRISWGRLADVVGVLTSRQLVRVADQRVYVTRSGRSLAQRFR